MERIGDKKRQVDELFCVAIQASPPSVAVTSLDLVPVCYDKPIERQVSLSTIKADLQAGKWIPGVELLHGTHVRIK